MSSKVQSAPRKAKVKLNKIEAASSARPACFSGVLPTKPVASQSMALRVIITFCFMLGISASSIVAAPLPAEAANAGSCVVAAVTLWPEGGAARVVTMVSASKYVVGLVALFNDFNSCYKWIHDSNPSAPPTKYDFCAGRLIVSNGLAWKVEVPCRNAGIYRLK
jgi:hypothetical protein